MAMRGTEMATAPTWSATPYAVCSTDVATSTSDVRLSAPTWSATPCTAPGFDVGSILGSTDGEGPVRYAICLRARCAVCGSDIAYGSVRSVIVTCAWWYLRTHAVCSVQCAVVRWCWWCAAWGSEIAYGGMRSGVVR
eukprot:140424-Rhodomonas_salina.1